MRQAQERRWWSAAAWACVVLLVGGVVDSVWDGTHGDGWALVRLPFAVALWGFLARASFRRAHRLASS